ncbi:ricin-type beta-trefoil lectin domain protein [Streptantibioticus rubrisoli]|uniref:Ricin-type beta-trefoil lectin domain protein n=1 Tax=Streptantibioticus rubrisoli TaxID=1387313 RepID=A0ABT1PH83_9ACTN|nr:ricin-type beta-trefoil lectin domain protein [Streptantibioticus rubrisoli]MCQ4044717.1 ricin-type beta-trefoil lectin domain protein [Streptantibioticus rubrisoli]
MTSLLASTVLLTAPAAAQAAQVPSGRTIHNAPAAPSVTGRITGVGGWCVDVAGANTANGTPIQQYRCNGTAAQQWTVGTDGTLRALGKCMDVYGGGTRPNTAVQLYDCNGTGAQHWAVRAGNMLMNPQSGLCLSSNGYGIQLYIWRCIPTPGGIWHLPA